MHVLVSALPVPFQGGDVSALPPELEFAATADLRIHHLRPFPDPRPIPVFPMRASVRTNLCEGYDVRQRLYGQVPRYPRALYRRTLSQYDKAGRSGGSIHTDLRLGGGLWLSSG